MACGELGLRQAEFEDMTFREFTHRVRGDRNKRYEMYSVMRNLAAWQVNIHIAKGDRVTPQQMLPLPIDGKTLEVFDDETLERLKNWNPIKR